MAPSPVPAVVPWRTTMRERHLAVPRAVAWTALLDHLGSDGCDLSVEPPWRHVRRLPVDGVEQAEQTITVRDDGAECHLAWCVGLTAELDDAAADAIVAGLAEKGEALLAAVATTVS